MQSMIFVARTKSRKVNGISMKTGETHRNGKEQKEIKAREKESIDAC